LIVDETRRLHSECLLLTLLERAIARYELTAARWTLLYVASGYVELAFQNSAVMARNGSCMPVVLFTSVSNARDGLSIERV
jgi:hypothetical protein